MDTPVHTIIIAYISCFTQGKNKISNNVLSNLIPVIVATDSSTEAPNSVVLPQPFLTQATPPSNLGWGWIDTTDSYIAKYFNQNTGTWIPMGTAGSSGVDGINAQTFSMLTAPFTAGAIADGELLCDVTNESFFEINAYVMVSDNTGTFAVYQVSAYSTDIYHPNGLLLTRLDPGTATNAAGSTYSFTAINNASCQITGYYQTTSDIVGAVSFQGIWDADTNIPTLTSGVGTKGYYYVVNVQGFTALDNCIDDAHPEWLINDWAIFNGTMWNYVSTGTSDFDIDGGRANSAYTVAQIISGGGA